MSRSYSSSVACAAALGALLLLGAGACQAIAGIEDRTLDPDGKQPPASPECREYCDRVMEACTDELAVYTTDETCLGVCALLEPGDPLEPAENTVACRSNQAKLALTTDEPAEHCRFAGPGGGGVCGSDCEAYCSLYAQACESEFPNVAACEKACAGLLDQDRFNVNVGADHEGDTVECRLVHVSSASVNPDEHCPHGPLAPVEPWCLPDQEQAPTCEEYCKIELAACDGEFAQYESTQQCLDVCDALEPGTNADRVENTVGCRRYHSFNSTLAPGMHCAHSGPSGDGHCGEPVPVSSGSTSNCDAYCAIARKACDSEFAAHFTTADACNDECLTLTGAEPESKYTVERAQESTGLACRLLYAVRAFEDPSACAEALGGAPCE